MGMLEKGIKAFDEYKYEDAIRIFSEIDNIDSLDKETMLELNKYIGMCHFRLANYMKALNYYKNCMIIAEDLNNNKLIFEAIYNMISLYNTIDDFKKAKELIGEALAIAEKDGDKFYIGKSYNAFGAICIDGSDEENDDAKKLATQYFKKGLKAIRGYGYFDLESMICSNLGYSYSKLGEIDLALEYLDKSLELAEKKDTFLIKPFALFTIGQTYFKANEIEKAIIYLDRALEIFKSIGERHRIAEAYQLYSEIYERKENYKEALEYQRLYSKLMIEIKNNDYINMVSKSQMEYDLLRAEKDNEIYKIKNEELSMLNNELNNLNKELNEAYREVNRLSERDYLTSVFNRRGLENKISKLNNTEVNGIILFDIDWFKKVNDNFGHDVGDKILKEMVDRITCGIDDEYILGRWGGEEFLIILPSKNKEDTYDFCLKVFDVMEKEFYIEEEKIKITITAGVDTFKNFMDFEAGVKRVDVKLYEGKKNGRNVIIG